MTNTETLEVTTSKKIKIFRNQSFLEKAQQGIAEYMSLTKQSIGSYWESAQSSAIGTGLTIEEQELLLPYVLDIPVDDRGFRIAVREFYIKMNTPIPYGTGAELEIGLKSSNDKPVSKSNLPIKMMDYLRYKHAIGHPYVAANAEEARGNQLKKYYVFDKNATEKATVSLNALKDEALQIYMRVKDDAKKVVAFLTLMGIDPRTYSGPNAADQRQSALREKADKAPTEVVKIDKLDNFEERYSIQAMVNTGVLNVYGTRYVIASNGESFGNDIDEAISRFKNPADKEIIIALKATTQEALKTGAKAGK